jgi:hypothetical protein
MELYKNYQRFICFCPPSKIPTISGSCLGKKMTFILFSDFVSPVL